MSTLPLRAHVWPTKRRFPVVEEGALAPVTRPVTDKSAVTHG